MKLLLNNPSLNHKNVIQEICKPLEKLNISYFSHAILDRDNKFSVICNNPDFIELYYNKEYFNIDLHTADIDQFGQYVIWDNVPRCGKTLQMGKDAAELKIIHTFSIIEKMGNERHIFHFSTHIDDIMMNQIYLTNVDLLKKFIHHFKTEVNNSKHLSKAHHLKIEVNRQAEGYSVKHPLPDHAARQEFISLLTNNLHVLTPREAECIKIYAHGKTAKEVAHQLGISNRTVEFHLAKAKMKLNVYSRSGLVSKVLPGYLDQIA